MFFTIGTLIIAVIIDEMTIFLLNNITFLYLEYSCLMKIVSPLIAIDFLYKYS